MAKGHPLEAQTEAVLDPATACVPGSAGAARSPLHALFEIGRLLLEQRRPQQVFAAIHDAIVDHLRPEHACVLSVTADGACRPIATHNLDLQQPQESWALSHTVLARVRATGLAVLASDVLGDPRFESAGSVHRLSIRSILCVPLGRDPVRGLIYLDKRSDDRPFSHDDLEYLAALSVHAALILERVEEHQRTVCALEASDERLTLLEGELLRHEIVGRSPKLLAAYDSLSRFARAGARVLLRGETGTGKELFARAYATMSPRCGRPYVPVPIPALAPTLLESELFGHVKGAFTEAARDKKGRLEVADGGVLFLDEIGDVEPSLQPKLLRFLDAGEITRVGDTALRHVDVLLVSATNRPLEKLVGEGRFRDDFLARLGHSLYLPPLRERPDDIPLLVEHFLRRHERGGRQRSFSPESLEVLKAYRWEFNVRQLEQVVERTMCLVDGDVVRAADLPEFVRAGAPAAPASLEPDTAPGSLQAKIAATEKEHILRVLRFTKGNKRRAIQMLEISSDTFYRRLREYGLQDGDPKQP